MARTLVIRGFDDEIHAQLGQMANQSGTSINSIVRDAVDKWLKGKSVIPKKHYLIIYSDEDSVVGLIKSMDALAKEAELVRCFCGPPDSLTTKQLTKLSWYDGTSKPYPYPPSADIHSNHQELQPLHQHQQHKPQSPSKLKIPDAVKYAEKGMKNIIKNAKNEQICCLDFVVNDIANSSLNEALTVEQAYDNNRISGIMVCLYRTDNLLTSETKDLIELFETHDQVFIVNDHEVYKLQMTKENVHKLFLN